LPFAFRAIRRSATDRADRIVMRSRKFALVPGGLLTLASNRMFEISTRVRERKKRPS